MPPANPNAPRKSRLPGCLAVGCLALVALAVIPPLLLWGLASEGFELPLGSGGPGERQRVEREHPLPGAAPLAAADEAGPTAAAGSAATSPEEAGSGAVPPAAATAELVALPGAARGRVILDVQMAELEIVPAPAGAPLRLVADYDTSRYRLEEELAEDAGEWTYRLELGGRGWRSWWNNSGTSARLRLEIPRGVPVVIEGKVGMGRSEMDLGGLTLAAVDLEVGMGDHEIGFAEPTVGTMAALEIESAMGRLDVAKAGNASPRSIAIDHGMGELTLDLGGAWRNDGEVELEVGMGNSRITLPDRSEASGIVVDTDVAMGEARIRNAVATADAPPGLPRVHIRSTGAMGNLDIR